MVSMSTGSRLVVESLPTVSNRSVRPSTPMRSFAGLLDAGRNRSRSTPLGMTSMGAAGRNFNARFFSPSLHATRAVALFQIGLKTSGPRILYSKRNLALAPGTSEPRREMMYGSRRAVP
jgi:hypothetical protein